MQHSLSPTEGEFCYRHLQLKIDKSIGHFDHARVIMKGVREIKSRSGHNTASAIARMIALSIRPTLRNMINDHQKVDQSLEFIKSEIDKEK